MLTKIVLQMAYELHGLLAGNVSIVTGENIKPSYGGDDEAFLRKVVTPIYKVIQTVFFSLSFMDVVSLLQVPFYSVMSYIQLINTGSWEEQKWDGSSLSLVQLRWFKWVFLVSLAFGFIYYWIWFCWLVSYLINWQVIDLAVNAFCCRSPDCFSLGWPMRDDGEFFKSTFHFTQVSTPFNI